MDKKFEKGQWVSWYNPSDVVNFGIICGEPTARKDGTSVYPITNIDGSKTAVGFDKLKKVPHMRKNGTLSKKKERELRNKMRESRKSVKQPQVQKEDIEDLKQRLYALERENKDLKDRNKSLENQLEKHANEVLPTNQSEITETLKQAVEQCLNKNPENHISHVKIILDALYKIAGI